jgi:hypothetical protein
MSWKTLPDTYQIIKNGTLYADDTVSMVVKGFVDEKTGEMKFYLFFMVEKIGIDNILKQLNKAD